MRRGSAVGAAPHVRCLMCVVPPVYRGPWLPKTLLPPTARLRSLLTALQLTATHVVWFRNDLRLHDHRPLSAAAAEAQQQGCRLAPVYVVDPRFYGASSFGFERNGNHRRRFLRESLVDLDRSLRNIDSRLHVYEGATEKVLTLLAARWDVKTLWFHGEFAPEEQAVASKVVSALRPLDIECRSFSPSLLHRPETLPFRIEETPEVFSRFRRKVEKSLIPEAPVAAVTSIPNPPPEASPHPRTVSPAETDDAAIERAIDEIRCLKPASSIISPVPEAPADSDHALRGGETEGLLRLRRYIWDRDCLRRYKQTRNGMLHFDDSSKFSPWLAFGCLSPRLIHADVKQYEEERISNDSTYWLIFELLWRDYFALMMAKHGAHLFRQSGLRGLRLSWNNEPLTFQRWREGTTGFPLIDANMRELSVSGFMSNRGRQNVASFLSKNLGLDWRLGAAWFESCLIDFDPCSNYGNWNYVAGVGNDAREFRWFNTIKQAQQYDPDGDYVRHWIPALSKVPKTLIHTPWMMTDAQQHDSDCMIGANYPRPMVDLFESAEANRRRFEAAT